MYDYLDIWITPQAGENSRPEAPLLLSWGNGGMHLMHQNSSSNVTVFWKIPLYSLYTRPSVVTKTG